MCAVHVTIALLLASEALARAKPGASAGAATAEPTPAAARPDPLGRFRSWEEAWAALSPYGLAAEKNASVPCGSGPAAAAACGVRWRACPCQGGCTRAMQRRLFVPRCIADMPAAAAAAAGGCHPGAVGPVEGQVPAELQPNHGAHEPGVTCPASLRRGSLRAALVEHLSYPPCWRRTA